VLDTDGTLPVLAVVCGDRDDPFTFDWDHLGALR
jgi:hypothetical protein